MKKIRSSLRSFLKNKSFIAAITAGDPAGIGPEVALKALNNLSHEKIIPVLICRKKIVENLYPNLCSDFQIISKFNEEELIPEKKYLLDATIDLPVPKPGEGSVDTGKESLHYIDTALDLWKAGNVHAIVTGPVHKGFIQKTGIPFIGHTEYMAEKINEPDPYMMMYSKDYRVLLASTHLALDKVPAYITKNRLIEVIKIGNSSISNIDGDDVTIAITGLDPHCGDDGAISQFDKEVTQKAVEEARNSGINIEGPFAADTLFMANSWKKFNLVIAQYHDQGLIPFKILAFDKGVNVTLGLSLIRTSVDHGTAFDIAGKDIAGYESMEEAIEVAYNLHSIKKM